MLLFDAARHDGRTTQLGDRFDAITDRVMGGRSRAKAMVETIAGSRALRLTGDVSLENNGGFVQMATDLALDASGHTKVQLEVYGNGETYAVHLRTADVRRPWQSYRQSFAAPPKWSTVVLAFAAFVPHRLEAPLDVTRLRRLGLIGIGRAFHADLAVRRIELL